MKINFFTPNAEIFNIGNKVESNSSSSFGEILTEKLNELNNKQLEADSLTQDFLEGGDTDIHEVMIAGEEAKLSLQLAIQVRNKILEGIKEINQIQI